MKVLIVSDTHRHMDNYNEVLKRVSPVDMIIHCGDLEGDEMELEYASDCPVEMVTGNNDFFSELPREREFEIGNYHVWLTHGHNYYVSMGNERIMQEARERGADIVMYGHTHRPVIESDGDVIAINPGSLTYPRQEGRRPSYIVMDVDRFGEAHFNICYL